MRHDTPPDIAANSPIAAVASIQTRFSDAQLSQILEQSAIYSCACPAQICAAINQQRALFRYQAECLNQTDIDVAVHRRIAEAARGCQAELEQCLHEVLTLEGWDMETLTMPENLGKRLLSEIADAPTVPKG